MGNRYMGKNSLKSEHTTGIEMGGGEAGRHPVVVHWRCAQTCCLWPAMYLSTLGLIGLSPKEEGMWCRCLHASKAPNLPNA